ncbi:MAG: hypothetical protein ABSG64_12715 [Solirubrobacteraceae bacterium]
MPACARRFSARRDDVVIEGVGSDLLIFDRRSDTAHCLGEPAALIWRSCADGATLSELAKMLVAHKLAGSRGEATTLAETALSEFAENGLLETSLEPGGIPRRQALRRIAGVGALAVGAPLIVSAGIPTSALANASLGTATLTITGIGGSTLSYVSTPTGDNGSLEFGGISVDQQGNVPATNLFEYVGVAYFISSPLLRLDFGAAPPSGSIGYVFTDSTNSSRNTSGSVSSSNPEVFLDFSSGDSIKLVVTLS